MSYEELQEQNEALRQALLNLIEESEKVLGLEDARLRFTPVNNPDFFKSVARARAFLSGLG